MSYYLDLDISQSKNKIKINPGFILIYLNQYNFFRQNCSCFISTINVDIVHY